MEIRSNNNAQFGPINNVSNSNNIIFNFKESSNNFSFSNEGNESKKLFDEYEPSKDDEDAKYWEDNTWRIDYFYFCDSNIGDDNKTELNPIKNS